MRPGLAPGYPRGIESENLNTATKTFVGRERELAELTAALAGARAGRGGFVLLSGEAGIGKTRLADAVAERAVGQGFRVLWGRSWESAGAAPFWPWVQILRTWVREAAEGALAGCPTGVLGHVAELVPEIRQRMSVPELPRRSTDSEEARFALFDAVSTFLAHAARERPLLVILDDVHWADLSSLVLLEFFAQSLPGLPVLVLATYRDPQAGETELDSGMLARLVRLGSHFTLRGLSKPEVGHFVEAAGGAKPLDSFVSALHGATNGNPFFVVEVLRLLAAEPQERQLEQAIAEKFPIPTSVRATIRKRISLLPAAGRSILSVGSVIGREFELGILERACDRPAAEVVDMLGRAAEAGIVIAAEAAGRRFAFSHGLVRETLYDDLSALDRALVHGRVAEAIESVHATRLEPHLAALAHHFAEAATVTGETTKAAEYSSRAAERAMATLATEEAVKHFDRALAFPMRAGGERVRCELLVRFGEALFFEGSAEHAVAVSREAAAIAERLGDAETLARAALGVASPAAVGTTIGGGDPALIGLLERSLAALPPADGTIRARLMARLGLELSQSYERERSRQFAADAVAMARRIGDPFTLAQALVWNFFATFGPDDLEKRLAAVGELRHLAETLEDDRFVTTAGMARANFLLERGDPGGARRELRALRDRRRGARYRGRSAEEADFFVADAMFALLEGRLGDVEPLGQRALECASLGPIAYFASVQILVLRREQGRIEELADAILGMMAGSASPTSRAFVCWILAEAGRLDEARRLLAELSAHRFGDFWRDLVWLWAMWLLAESVTLLEDRERAGPLLDLLGPFADRVVGTYVLSAGPVARSLGNLETLLGRFEDAERHFATALLLGERWQARLWVAWTEYDYARMLFARDASGDRDRAVARLDRAIAAARETGMVLLEQRATRLQERFGGSAPVSPAVELRSENGRWTIRYKAPAFQLRDGKGLRYLAHLLRQPGEELHVADLVAAVEGRAGEPAVVQGDTGEILDSRARDEYRERLAALEQELEEATARSDAGRIEKLSEEIEFVKDELSAAYGLGGRARRGGDVAERIRKAVTNRIRGAIAEIERHDPDLARHLTATIRTGKFCAYEPDLRR